MTGEIWHVERDRIVLLLNGLDSGVVTHVDQENLRQLAAVSPRNLALLRERLANRQDRRWPANKHANASMRIRSQLPNFDGTMRIASTGAELARISCVA